MSRIPRVLIVDDEPYVRESLAEVLGAEGFEVRTASAAGEALELLESLDFDVVLTDLRLGEPDGLWLLERVRAAHPSLPVILFTGAGSVRDAVQAMKVGAFDFVLKPVDPEELSVLVRRATEHRALLAEVGQLRRKLRDLRGPRRMVGSSLALRQVLEAVERVGPTEATVFVTGESGTGKELVAEAIHRASPRRECELVEVNCAAIPEELFESELFGHRRGSFTGAVSDRRGRFGEAEGGTLVLDEVGTLTPALQAKLLRVLETGEYQMVGESRTRVADVRVVAITNEKLAERVKEGSFRADLYYRLNVFPIEVPPLRLRKEDIAELVLHMLSQIPGAPPRIGEQALALLRSYDWPGNVRELRNVLERASIASGPVAELRSDLLRPILESALPSIRMVAGMPGLRERLDAHERDILLAALASTEGRRGKAAEMLGIDPRNFGYYLKKHGIEGASSRAAAE
jgi:DNA-binding NtrC family response regulator